MHIRICFRFTVLRGRFFFWFECVFSPFQTCESEKQSSSLVCLLLLGFPVARSIFPIYRKVEFYDVVRQFIRTSCFIFQFSLCTQFKLHWERSSLPFRLPPSYARYRYICEAAQQHQVAILLRMTIERLLFSLSLSHRCCRCLFYFSVLVVIANKFYDCN